MQANVDDLRRRLALEVIFSELEIPHDVLDVVSAINPGADNPYHGTQHLYTVAIRAGEAGEIYGFTKKVRRELVLAGLFHDYGHPLHTDDAVNVEAAVKGWYAIGVPYDVDASPGEVERFIRATQFPHSAAADEMEAIIQDADLMQSLEPDRERFYRALGVEQSIPTPTDASTADFLQSQTINTIWARHLLAERLAH